MSEAKHTPGPWKVVSQAVTQEIEVFEIAEVSHLRVICDRSGDGFQVAGTPEADARLIAAAPELLAFAKTFLADYQSEYGMGSMKHYAKKAHAAISKALGEQQ